MPPCHAEEREKEKRWLSIREKRDYEEIDIRRENKYSVVHKFSSEGAIRC